MFRYKNDRIYWYKGNQPWIFTGRTEAETPILWLPDVKNWLIGKDPDAGKDWRQEEKGTTEREMVGWHHRLNGHEFEYTLEVGDGQGGLAYCSPRGRRVRHDWAEQLNRYKSNHFFFLICPSHRVNEALQHRKRCLMHLHFSKGLEKCNWDFIRPFQYCSRYHWNSQSDYLWMGCWSKLDQEVSLPQVLPHPLWRH